MALHAKKPSRVSSGFLAALLFVVLILVMAIFERGRSLALAETPSVHGPWMDKTLSPDRRADLVLQEMTLDEKIALLHGNGMPGWPRAVPHANPYLGNGGAGFVLGVQRLGIGIADPAAVMCSYNAVNGDYACENKYLLTDVLKKDWNFKGFVVSDWGGTHSTEKASAAGLDHEEPMDDFFGDKFKQTVEAGKIPTAELDDHVHRILRSEFASGIVDDPVKKSVVDVEGGLEISRHIAEQSIVLLKNDRGILPLDRAKLHSIAVIGPNADTSMISGGGSAQVDPPGHGATKWKEHVWFPSSPLKAIARKTPGATVEFDSGADPAYAAALAERSDVAIVFAYQWTSEDMDLPNLSLPENQDAMIEQVAAANPQTIVVLETGTAVTMPWLNAVRGVLEAWYTGSQGADAVANILFGEVNPTAK